MSSTAPPSITVDLAAGPREIVFDLGMLMEIEDRSGRGCAEILATDFAPIAQAAGGGDVNTATRSIRVTTLASFVGYCLGCDPKRVGDVIKPGTLLEVFVRLFGGFAAALGQLGGAAEAEETNQAGPQLAGSAPGHASSSASTETNSPASAPAS